MYEIKKTAKEEIGNCRIIQSWTNKNKVKSEISKDHFNPESPSIQSYETYGCPQMVCPNRAVVVKALRSFAILNDEHRGREAKHLFAHGADGFFFPIHLLPRIRLQSTSF